MITLLLDPTEFEGREAAVRGEAYRHLFRAARLRVGDALRVVDGRGRARAATVAAVDRREATLALHEEAPSLEPSLHLELLVATPRPQRADWLVEKATEVGAAAIRFVETERSQRRFSSAQIARLERVARAAVEQCGRARLPEVTGTHTWPEIEPLVEPLPRRVILDFASPVSMPAESARAQTGRGSHRTGTCLPEGAATGAVALLIGPEGGWTDAERQHLMRLGCSGFALGPRTLRVETAAVVGSALFLLPVVAEPGAAALTPPLPAATIDATSGRSP